MRRFIGIIMLLAFISVARGQNAYSYRYWFDNNLATLQMGSTTGEVTIEIDISALVKGAVHTLHFQGIDVREKWSPVRTQYFFIAKDTETEAATARYWYDNDEKTVQTAPTVNGLIDLDISHMEIGTHAVHYQTFNAVGEASPVHTQYFYMNELQDATLSFVIWIDDDEDGAQVFPMTKDDIVIDVKELSIGVHDLHVKLLDSKGQCLAEDTTAFEIPIPTETIILSDALGDTYCSSMDLDFKGVTGLKAYIVCGFNPDENVVWIMRVDNVPADEGIFIKGTPGTYQVPYSKTGFHYNNMLAGSHVKQTLPTTSDGYANYTLKDGIFLQSDGTASVDVNKAYLRVPTSWVPSETAARALRIRIVDEIIADVNGDGDINMQDVMSIVNYILGKTDETFNAEAADVNGDGEINMRDLMFLVNYILNGKFPDEE